VAREEKTLVKEVDWKLFWTVLALSGAGFYCALTTRLGVMKQGDYLYGLRLYVKWGGWVLAVGSLIGAIEILLILIGYLPE
jgi:hypothetical protein